MAFTIDPSIPPLVFGLGQAFSFQPSMAVDSTPEPTGWAVTGLPVGVSIDPDTGKISGAANEAGVFDLLLTATGSGPVTDSVAFQLGIADRAGYDALLGGAVEMNMDLRTGYVYVLNTTAGVAENGERGAILYAKRGDVIQIAQGLEKDGELQDLIVTDIRVALKRYEPDAESVISSTGEFWKSGAYEAARYLFEAALTSDILDTMLAEEEEEDGTFVDLIAETQVVYEWYPPGVLPTDDPPPTPRELVRTSQEYLIRVARDWIPED